MNDETVLNDLDIAKDSENIGEELRLQGREKENRPISRKPLQRKPQPTTGHDSVLPSAIYSDFQAPRQEPSVSTQLRRKPVERSATNKVDERQRTIAGTAPQLPARQPLGPRPLHCRFRSLDAGTTSAEKELPNLPPRTCSPQARSPARSAPSPSRTAEPHTDLSRPNSRSRAESVSTKELSLTLIRRDPVSGGQWNVGKILSVPLGELAPDTGQSPQTKSSKSFRKPLDVEIRTPGYGRFKSSNAQTSITSPHQGATFLGNQQFGHAANGGAFWDDGIFRRRISFEHSAPPQHQSRRQRPTSSEAFGASNLSGGSYDRYDSRATSDKQGQADECAIEHIDMSSAETKSKPQGYTFLSPWNGTCDFLTGVTGRNLTCKHRLPVGAAATSSTPVVTVSELRFNLPSSALFTVGAPNASGSRRQESSSLLAKYRHRRQASSDSGSRTPPSSEHANTVAARSSTEASDAEDGRLDLSLGQEHAGGGFGGKQAKLGKLIIEDEGLKMLDLVVAANMALWWHVYERCTPPAQRPQS